MAKQRITTRTIAEYERQCTNLAHDLEQVAARLRAIDADWESESRPNGMNLTDIPANIMLLAAKRVRIEAQLERGFIESQREVRRLRREQSYES